MSTAAIYVPAIDHNKTGHPENKGRISRILPFLEQSGMLPDLCLLEPELATIKQLRRVHAPTLIEHIREVAATGGGALDHGDTYATPQSFELARLAAGATMTAVDAIMTGRMKTDLLWYVRQGIMRSLAASVVSAFSTTWPLLHVRLRRCMA